PAIIIISVDEFIAIYFPIALPPTVKAAMILVKNTDKPICKSDSSSILFIFIISIITTINALPLIILVISPITSLQKLANLSSFLVTVTAPLSSAPISSAIALNDNSMYAVAATHVVPINIPTITNTSTTDKQNIHETLPSINDDTIQKIAVIPNVITAM